MTRSRIGWHLLAAAFGLAFAGVTPAASAHGGDPTLVHACVNQNIQRSAVLLQQ